MDSSNGDMVTSSISKDKFDFDLGIYEIHSTLCSAFSKQFKVHADSDYGIIFYTLDPTSMAFFISAPTYANKEGLFEAKEIKNVSV